MEGDGRSKLQSDMRYFIMLHCCLFGSNYELNTNDLYTSLTVPSILNKNKKIFLPHPLVKLVLWEASVAER